MTTFHDQGLTSIYISAVMEVDTKRESREAKLNQPHKNDLTFENKRS